MMRFNLPKEVGAPLGFEREGGNEKFGYQKERKGASGGREQKNAIIAISKAEKKNLS